MQNTTTTPTRRRARKARVAKTVTSDTLAAGGKLDAAGLDGGSGITELYGVVVSREAAAKILKGEVKAIAKTTEHSLANQTVLLLHKGRAVGEVELGGQTEPRTWAVKTTKVFERPKATTVPELATGVVSNVRILERRKASVIDEPVTKGLAKHYDPKQVADGCLVLDVRKLAEFGEEAALKKALTEMADRGLQLGAAEHPEVHRAARELGLTSRVVKQLEIAPDTEPETMTTAELAAAHRALHRMAVVDVTKGWSSEDMVGLHAQVVTELEDRGVPHPEPPADDMDRFSEIYAPERREIKKSDTEGALGELLTSTEHYPVLVHKRVEGLRVTVAKTGDAVKVVGEDGADHTAEVPTVVEAVKALDVPALELEGDLERWHGGDVLQVSDLSFDGRDLRDWPVNKRLERLSELGLAQATSATPSLDVPINELPAIQVGDVETLERAIRVVKALPGSAGAIIKPETSVEPGDWVELEAEPVAKTSAPGPVPFVLRGSWCTADLLVGVSKGRRAHRWALSAQTVGDQEVEVAKGATSSLIDLQTGEWRKGEVLANRRPPVPWAAMHLEEAGVHKAIDRGVVELGAKKPWLQEYFVRGEKTAYRLELRKAYLGEITKAQHAYTTCMTCKAAPVIDVLWADGRGRGWFCKGCYPKWLAKNGGAKTLEVIGTKAIIGGRAPAKFSDRHNRVATTKAVEPNHFDNEWVATRAEDLTPYVLQTDAVHKQWIPPLGQSALPEAVAEQVPDSLAYWHKQTLTKAREIRDQLVSQFDTGELKLDFSLATVEAAPVEPTPPAEAPVDLFVSIAKIDMDRQIVTGVVLEPGEVDAQNDTVSAEVIEKASIKFLSGYNSETQLGFMHKVFGEIGLKLAASWVTLNNQTLGGKKVKRGTWLMSVKVIDSKLWARVKKGDFAGFSIGGVATVRGS